MNDMVMKLDDFGRPAWIALMVVSFIVFWPLGLAVLAFLLWSGRMGCGSYGGADKWRQHMHDRFERRMERWQRSARGFPPSGNRAFDEYREETLKRLEDEQREFRDFLERLRMAKDRSEFDQFMTERKSRPGNGSPDADKGPEPAPQV